MELIGDVGHVESCFGLLVDSVSVGQDRCAVCAKRKKSFWTHPMVLLGDEALVEAHFGLFGDIANLDAR
jgi:hypothetical protein